MYVLGYMGKRCLLNIGTLLKKDIMKMKKLTAIRKILRRVIFFEKFALDLFEKESHCQSKRCGFFLHSDDERYGASPDALGPADIILEIKRRAKNCSSPLQSLKRKGSYLQAQQQMQCTGASFCILMSYHPESNTAKYFIIKRDDTLFFVCKSENKVITEWPHVENDSYQSIGKILNGTVPNFDKLKLLRSFIVKKVSSVPQVSFDH